MQAVNYSHARNNLKSLIEEVCNEDEQVIITTKNNKSAVLISLDEYNRTFVKVKKEVREALAEVERGDVLGIDEAFEKVLQKYED